MTVGYWGAAAATWWIGFFPLAELYIAVPAGVALGLDYPSAVLWTLFGNYAPILVIRLAFDRMMRHASIGQFLQNKVARRVSSRWRERLERNPLWLLLLTPLAGVWATAVACEAARLKPVAYLLWTFLSILIFSMATAVLLKLGLMATGAAAGLAS
jgi:hypothetical protein